MSTAVARRFNPTEYKNDFADLIAVNPALAADTATKLAKKKRNAEIEVNKADDATRELVAFLGTTTIMAAAGMWAGSLNAKRDRIVQEWEAEGASSVGAALPDAPTPWSHERGVKDPSKIWIFPKLLVVPLVTGTMGVIAAWRRKGAVAGTFERTMNMATGSTFGLVVANAVGQYSYTMKEKKLAGTDVTSVKPLAAAS